MATATATFDKKTVYHSTLRSAGSLVVMFTSEVKESQYRGKPPYVEFKVQGDDSTYQYNTENDAIAELIRGIPRNEWVEITATGTKEEADIEVTYDRSRPPAQSNGADRHPNAPPPQQESNGNGGGDSLARVLWRCIETSVALNEQFEKRYGRPMTENDRALAVSLSIEVHRGNRLPLTA